ncbi:MAG TPA: glyceraldehyde 3-phosphate dehydrogenase NAD-binding domain-containing protein [Thermoanaerobaculia bacterium]|nr:glyceraldehyde 3-phosphate dehydrogenase NAD-binding domain-containing protein [Thermoanaerobaculia bacterium]
MSLRFGINGVGRIGRALLRLAHGREELVPAAVNDLAPPMVLARLLARDSVHGPFPGTVAAVPRGIALDGRQVPAFAAPEPTGIPWESAGVEVVIEATGRFLGRSRAAAHLRVGNVRTVVLSANPDPADPVDVDLCWGLNEDAFDPRRHAVVSLASCTTSCLALVAKVLHDGFTIRHALMNTVHSYTENQRLLDSAHADPRRSRAAAQNIIPVATTTPFALGRLMPELAGRFAGVSVRVPTPAVAMLDLVARVDRPASAAAVRDAFRAAAAGERGRFLGVTEEELVSSDFVGDPRSAVVDLPLVQVVGGDLVRVVAWYDNEWGYANRLLDLLLRLARAGRG